MNTIVDRDDFSTDEDSLAARLLEKDAADMQGVIAIFDSRPFAGRNKKHHIEGEARSESGPRSLKGVCERFREKHKRDPASVFVTEDIEVLAFQNENGKPEIRASFQTSTKKKSSAKGGVEALSRNPSVGRVRRFIGLWFCEGSVSVQRCRGKAVFSLFDPNRGLNCAPRWFLFLEPCDHLNMISAETAGTGGVSLPSPTRDSNFHHSTEGQAVNWSSMDLPSSSSSVSSDTHSEDAAMEEPQENAEPPLPPELLLRHQEEEQPPLHPLVPPSPAATGLDSSEGTITPSTESSPPLLPFTRTTFSSRNSNLLIAGASDNNRTRLLPPPPPPRPLPVPPLPNEFSLGFESRREQKVHLPERGCWEEGRKAGREEIRYHPGPLFTHDVPHHPGCRFCGVLGAECVCPPDTSCPVGDMPVNPMESGRTESASVGPTLLLLQDGAAAPLAEGADEIFQGDLGTSLGVLEGRDDSEGAHLHHGSLHHQNFEEDNDQSFCLHPLAYSHQGPVTGWTEEGEQELRETDA
uniref:Uncharacterized protein n=1 Tax=Chromera velia CCMP2878 TaxID=1169474 RepID=A0A0G4H490_9ALVE|eukprot:Cvel_5684.t1-p1 / transcript=Cvel_5684.t1 / gene=Cvel_5684 / organism=Chromera_velia_CCMP2878 / gene_product=hypothetical protein / transcript_product=hypothetical protein / location=Cvel_scaffold268:101568-104370(+) / protein_length=521 / sequence_SO=supercontig / SO=protein_coding / is_pseudo=false